MPPAITADALANHPNGTNVNSGTFTFTVTFDNAVTVTNGANGNLGLVLNNSKTAAYSGISSDNKTLTFTYTVGAGGDVSDLQATGFSALKNGATVKDAASGNLDANLSTNFQTIDTLTRIDTTPPAQPGKPVLAAASDSGSSNGDQITKVTTPTITGSAEAGATVTLYDTNGTTVLGSATATGGTYSIASSALTDATHSLTVTATDAAGNTSVTSQALAVTIDTTPPAQPGTPVLAAASDTGSSNGDQITKVTTPTITGSAEAGATVTLYDTNGTTVLGSATATGGTYSIASSALTDATHSLTVTATDAAGNTSVTSQALAVTIDATPPTVNSIALVGSSPNNAASETFTVTFSEPVTGVDASDFTVTGSATASGTVSSVTGSGTIWTVTVGSVAGDGTLRLDIDSSGHAIADTAGNILTAGYTGGPSYTLDHTQPAVTSVSVPTDGTYVAGQDLTFTAHFSETVTVTGTPLIPITLDTGGPVYAQYVSGTGTNALTFRYQVVSGEADTNGVSVGSAITLNGGAIKDAVGNDATSALASVANTSAVLVDSIAPTVSSVAVPANGTYGTGQVLAFTVNFSEPVLVTTGGGTPSIGVTLDTGGIVQAAYTGGSGTSALAFAYTVANGNADPNGIAVGSTINLNGGTIKDAATNATVLTLSGVGSTANVDVEAVPPTVTSIDIAGTSLSNAASETFTVTFSEPVTGVDASAFTVARTGTVSAGALTNANVVPTGGGNGPSASWTVTVPNVAGDGTLRLDLTSAGHTISDRYGNALVQSHTGDQGYTIDHTAPPPPTGLADVAIVNGTVNAAGDTATQTLTGSAEPGSTVAVYDGMASLGTTQADATTGAWAYTLGHLADGGHSLTAAATDVAGNTGPASSPALAFTVDTTAPTIAITTPIAGDNTLNKAEAAAGFAISGTTSGAETGQSVTVTLVNAAKAVVHTYTGTVSGNAWSVGVPSADATTLADGAYTITADVADRAGNPAPRASQAIGVDETAPVAASLVLTHDTGASATDRITRDSAIAYTPSAAGDTLLYSIDGQAFTTTAPSLSTNGTAEGQHIVSVAERDAAGNVSLAATLTFTLDTVVPAAPTVALAHDTGISVTDKITTDASLTVTPAEAGGSLSYVVDGTPVASYDTTTVGQGAHSVAVKQTDIAGNVSVAGSTAFTLDSAAPTANADKAGGTGYTATLTGNVLANDTDATGLHVSALQFAGGLARSLPADGSVTLDGEHGSLTLSADGSYSYHPYAAGSDVFTYTATDAAGNASQTTLGLSIASPPPPPASQSFAFAFTDAHFDFSHGRDLMTTPTGTVIDLTGIGTLTFTDGTVQEKDGAPLVDDLFYDANNLDVWRAHVDPDLHYRTFGWKEGRDPNAAFSTTGYLAANPDVAAAKVDPLQHYDTFGWKEGRSPGPNFSAEAYLAQNPDVAAAKTDPLLHDLAFGQAEGRVISDGETRGADGHRFYGDFDADFYLAHNPDVASAASAAHMSADSYAYTHYLTYGWHEGRDPDALFSTRGYLAANPDVAAAGLNPLLHYEAAGWHEGRDPSTAFRTNAYLAAHPDVAAAQIDPLGHYLKIGFSDGHHIA